MKKYYGMISNVAVGVVIVAAYLSQTQPAVRIPATICAIFAVMVGVYCYFRNIWRSESVVEKVACDTPLTIHLAFDDLSVAPTKRQIEQEIAALLREVHAKHYEVSFSRTKERMSDMEELDSFIQSIHSDLSKISLSWQHSEKPNSFISKGKGKSIDKKHAQISDLDFSRSRIAA